MHLSAIELYRYHLPLRHPLAFKGGALQHRDGLLLHLCEADGRDGWGEIAPLPHFSAESLAEAQKQALTLALRPRDFWNSFQFMDVLPSVRFGVEIALLNLNNAWQTKHDSITLNALLIGSDADCMAQAKVAKAKGYKAAKLKVGHRSIEADAALVQEISAALGEDCCLRLDANRAWTWDEALSFAHRIQHVPIEYIEEPLQNAALLPKLAAETKMHIALDESLRAPDFHAVQDFQTYILKPMLDRNSVFSYLKTNKRLVLSSSVESGVGMLALLKMASFLNETPLPMGFDTYNWLAEDVIEPRLDLSKPMLPVADFIQPSFRVRTEILERLV